MYFYVFTVPLPCDAGLALVAENCTAQQGIVYLVVENTARCRTMIGRTVAEMNGTIT